MTHVYTRHDSCVQETMTHVYTRHDSCADDEQHYSSICQKRTIQKNLNEYLDVLCLLADRLDTRSSVRLVCSMLECLDECVELCCRG